MPFLSKPSERLDNGVASGASKPVSGNASVTKNFVPYFASRAQVACWMSILKLIREHPQNAWFWTFTFAEVLPYHYAANCHRLFTSAIGNATKTTSWPKDWGAVKVAERHPSGHGLHFHWVAYPRLDIRNVLPIAHSCGFGRVHVHPDCVTEKVATYLAKYLVKGEAIPSVKQWACLGNFEGVRVADVEMSSRSIDTFRQAFREARANGVARSPAFLHAKKVQREFDLNHDDSTSL